MTEHTREQALALPQVKVLLTIDEVAHALSLGRTVVYRLVMQKQIFSVKVGGARRIPVAAVHTFVEQLAEMQKVS